MEKILVFENRPDYVFGDDELGNTFLVWPERYTFTEETDGFSGESECCFHVRAKMESGEYIEYRIFNYPLPKSFKELEEIFENAESSEIQKC